MNDVKERVSDLTLRFGKIKDGLHLEEKRKRIEILTGESENPNLWNEPERAKATMQELSDLKGELAEVEKVSAALAALSELLGDEELANEVEKETGELTKRIHKLELASFLSGDYDGRNAIVSIHAGQGGTEAMDWASMLYRMYMMFAQRRGWPAATLDMTPGEEAGIKSVTFRISAPYAYGYLRGEAGSHRLVRQSPFNADKLRQTSFALVEVLPELGDADLPDIEIKDEDLEIQFFHSSSQGGQNVQKVSTAVRLIHKPTGIVVTAQAERFQEQNRKNALSLLKGKLWLRRQEEIDKEKKALKGGRTMASWGTQIRSYVLHPYKMVKDLRTEVETGDTEAVLNGEIDEFIEADLKI